MSLAKLAGKGPLGICLCERIIKRQGVGRGFIWLKIWSYRLLWTRQWPAE